MGRQVKKVNNIIRLILSIIFLFTQLGIDIRPVHSAMPQILPLPNPSEITIPEAYGKITEVFKGDSDKLVFHIQDLHTNPEAQLNASKIMEYLIDTYGIKLLTIEGEAGHIDPEWLANVSLIKIINDKMAEIFLNSGEMTGEEYLYVTRYPKYKDVVFRGIEDKDSYWKNREVFNRMYPRIRENMRLCDNIKGSLDRLKKAIYPEAAVELDEKRASYEARELEVKDYTSYLIGIAKEKDIDLSKYENFSILSKLVEIQERLEFSKVDKERTLLFDALSKALSEEHAKAMMEKVKEHNEGKLTAIEFYTYLKELAANNNIDFTQYSNIITYMEYISTSDRLDNTHLFKELEQVEDAITEAYLTADEQKQLARLSKNLSIMKKFFDINLSNEDLDYYQKNKDEFKVQAFVDFIKEKAKQHNVRISTDPSLSQLDKTLVEQDEFYKVVLVRDEAMVKNTLKRMDEFNANITIQPIGGFHTKGMAKMYKEQGISYVVISPHVTKEFDEENYRNILQNKKKSPEELVSEQASTFLRPQEFVTQDDSKPRAVALAFYLARNNFKPEMSDEEALRAALTVINPVFQDKVVAGIPELKEVAKALRDEADEVPLDGLTTVEQEYYKGLGIDLSDVVFITGFGFAVAAMYDPVRKVRRVHRAWGLAGIVQKKVGGEIIGTWTAKALAHLIDGHEGIHAKGKLDEKDTYAEEIEVLLAKPIEERREIQQGLGYLLRPTTSSHLGEKYIEFVGASVDDDINLARANMEKIVPIVASESEKVVRLVKAEEPALAGTTAPMLLNKDESSLERRRLQLADVAKSIAVVAPYKHDGYAKAQDTNQGGIPAQMVDGNLSVDVGVLFDKNGIVRVINPTGTFLGYKTKDLEGRLVKIINTYGFEEGELKRIISDFLGVDIEVQVVSLAQVESNPNTLKDDNLVYLNENANIFETDAVKGVTKRHVVINLAEGQEVYLSLFAISYALADSATQQQIGQIIKPPELKEFITVTNEKEVTVTPAPNSFFDSALIEALRAIQR